MSFLLRIGAPHERRYRDLTLEQLKDPLITHEQYLARNQEYWGSVIFGALLSGTIVGLVIGSASLLVAWWLW